MSEELPEQILILASIDWGAAWQRHQAVASALAAGGFRTRMQPQVHDELLFESPGDEVPRLEGVAREVMESAMALDVPLKVDIKTGVDWAQA